MRKFISILLTVFLLGQNGLAFAKFHVPSSTVILAAPEREIDADKVKIGDKLGFRVVAPVVVRGIEVVRAGTWVIGEVTARKNNNFFSAPGVLEVSNFAVKTIDGSVIALTGSAYKKGEPRYWADWGILSVLSLPLLILKGHDVKLSPDECVTLFTANDLEVNIESNLRL